MRLLVILLLAGIVNFSSPVRAQEDNTQIRGPRDTDTLAQQRTIGPLSASDTLWRVAERIKPEGNVSLYQVMYALYLKNPDAFIDGNLNHLRPGSTLLVPTLREVRQVDVDTARNKSEQDDKTWALRQKAAAARQVTPAAGQLATPEAPPVWQAELQRLNNQQQQELDALRTQFGDSIQRVETLSEQNQQLRDSLTNLQHELELLKQQLGEDSELQQQIQLLLAQQAELLAVQAKEQQEQQQGFNWSSLWSNPLSWIIAACVPALLILFSVLLWVKKRSKKTEDVINAATTEPVVDPNYKSPLPPLDDNNDLDESLFELDDALLDEAFQDTGDFSTDEMEDDSLPGLDEELSFGDDDLVSDDSLLPPSDLANDNDPELLAEDDDIPLQSTDPDNLLSDDDLTALLAAEDDDDDIIELAEDDGGLSEDEDLLLAEESELTDELLTDELLTEPELTEGEDTALTQDNEPDLSSDEFDLSELTETASDVDEAFSADDLIEEIELDLPADDADEDAEQRQITAALTELESLPQVEPETKAESESKPVETDSGAEAADDLLNIDEQADTDDQFDSTELDAFAESLAAENAAPDTLSGVTDNPDDSSPAQALDDELPEDTESLLSAELAELLEQVEAEKPVTAQPEDEAAEPEVAESDIAEPSIAELEIAESEVVENDADEIELDDTPDLALNEDFSIEDTELSQPDTEDALPEHDTLTDEVDTEQSEADEPGLEDDGLASEQDSIYELADAELSLEELLDDDIDTDEKLPSAPDLTTLDDGSVTRLSEAALSVENPSKILEQYPELELSDDELLAELDGDVSINELTTDEILLPDSEEATPEQQEAQIELDPLADQQFDELMNELEAMAGKIGHTDTHTDDEPVQFIDADDIADEGAFDLSDDDFVEIDKLLAGTDSSDLDPDRFSQLNVDVGLDEFADIIGEHEQRDVDSEDNGFAAKMDLVRAYIEIDDHENADLLINDILQSDAPEHVKTEAKILKSDN